MVNRFNSALRFFVFVFLVPMVIACSAICEFSSVCSLFLGIFRGGTSPKGCRIRHCKSVQPLVCSEELHHH